MRNWMGLVAAGVLAACSPEQGEKKSSLPPLPEDPCGTEEWAVEQVYAQQRAITLNAKAVDFEETTVKRDGDSCRYRVETVEVVTYENGDILAYRLGFNIERERGSRVWSYAMPETIPPKSE